MERNPNVIAILGLAAVIAAYVIPMDPVPRCLLWIVGLVAGFIGLFRPGRVWGILAVAAGFLPMCALLLWVGVNYDQLAADGYFGEAPAQVESVEVADVAAEEVAPAPEPVRQWIEIKSPRGGYVKVYIGMSTDEVKALIGRPSKVRATDCIVYLEESWEYDMGGFHWMTLSFHDGKLSRINQY